MITLTEALKDVENIIKHKPMKDEAQKPVGEVNMPDKEAEKKEPAFEHMAEVKEPQAEDRSAYNCPSCQGEGLINDNSVLCPNCHGTGKI